MSVLVILIVLIIGIFVPGTGFSQPDCAGDGCGEPLFVDQRPWQPVMVGGIEGVIVPAEDAGMFGFDEGWTPSDVNVIAAEEAIVTSQGALDHLRQYVGFMHEGDRMVHINGFCDYFGEEWRYEPILVNDGGECFFGATYNVETDELVSFSFHGEA